MKGFYGIEGFLGKTITEIQNNDDRELIFTFSNGEVYIMFHEQDCCEDVYIEDIAGNLYDLIDSPLTMAEEVINEDSTDYTSITWTFYKLATVKGYVTIRWCGESNGYYSESVDIFRLK